MEPDKLHKKMSKRIKDGCCASLITLAGPTGEDGVEEAMTLFFARLDKPSTMPTEYARCLGRLGARVAPRLRDALEARREAVGGDRLCPETREEGRAPLARPRRLSSSHQRPNIQQGLPACPPRPRTLSSFRDRRGPHRT